MISLLMCVAATFTMCAREQVVAVEEQVTYVTRWTNSPAAICVTVEEYDRFEDLVSIRKYYGYTETLAFQQDTLWKKMTYYALRITGRLPRVRTYAELPQVVRDVVSHLSEGSSWIRVTTWSVLVSQCDSGSGEPAKNVEPQVNECAPVAPAPIVDAVDHSTSIFDSAITDQMMIALP